MQKYTYKKWHTTVLQFTLYSFLFLFFYQKYLYAFGPDFVSYYAIAKHYAGGDFKSGINSWWSPLFSWLIAILIKVYDNPVVINKILQFFFGWYCFNLARQLVFFFVKPKKNIYIEILCIGLIPFLVNNSLRSDTPDLLVAALLLHFIILTMKLMENYKFQKAIFTGFIAGLAVLAKSYNFYFIVIFSIVCLIYFLMINKNKHSVFRNYFNISIPFAIICTIWICILYSKTDKLMISSIAIHQTCNGETKNINESPLQPYDCNRLGINENNFYSNWENPNIYNSLPIGTTLLNDKSNVWKNILSNVSIFFKHFLSILQLVIFLFCLCFCFMHFKKYAFLLIAFIGIFNGGYFLLHIEYRFLLVTFILLMILLISVLYLAFFNRVNKIAKIGLTSCIIVLLSKSQLQQLIFQKQDEKPKTLFDFAKRVSFTGKNIAGDTGLFEEALYLSFYTKSKCVGALNVALNSDEARDQMMESKVDFILTKINNQYELLPFINSKSIQIK